MNSKFTCELAFADATDACPVNPRVHTFQNSIFDGLV